MRQDDSELFSALRRVMLGLLLWNAANLALFAAAAVSRRMTGLVMGTGWWEVEALWLMSDLIELSERTFLLFLFTLAMSALAGVSVALLALALRLAGRVSLARPDVRRALRLAGASVALPLALAAAAVVYFILNPPRLMF